MLGAVLIVGGLLTLFWPGPTLWTIAVLTGLSLLIHGIGRVAWRSPPAHEMPSWGWFAFAGALNIVVGILALAWPEATILVLSLMLGFQILIFGVFLLVAAFMTSAPPLTPSSVRHLAPAVVPPRDGGRRGRVRGHLDSGRPRGVAQLGSAPALGAGGRGFKSRHPDRRDARL